MYRTVYHSTSLYPIHSINSCSLSSWFNSSSIIISPHYNAQLHSHHLSLDPQAQRITLSRLKTHLFHKFFPPFGLPSRFWTRVGLNTFVLVSSFFIFFIFGCMCYRLWSFPVHIKLSVCSYPIVRHAASERPQIVVSLAADELCIFQARRTGNHTRTLSFPVTFRRWRMRFYGWLSDLWGGITVWFCVIRRFAEATTCNKHGACAPNCEWMDTVPSRSARELCVLIFSARCLTRAMLSLVRPSVRASVTRVDQSKWLTLDYTISTTRYSSIPLVLRDKFHQDIWWIPMSRGIEQRWGKENELLLVLCVYISKQR